VPCKLILLTEVFKDGVLGEGNGNNVVPQRVSMDKDLSDERALLVDSFQLLRHNVLALR
jgi:hypothetical protein